MTDSHKGPSNRPRRSSNVHISNSGKQIKLNQSLTGRMKASKQARSLQKAEYLSTLPKEKWLRVLYRMHPKRVMQYWFSRKGAIMALKLTGIGIIVCFFLVVGVFAYFRKDLPKINDLSGNKLGGSITYYDKTGQTVLWQDYNAVKRVPVPGDQISDYLRQATVAIEDKNFYKHGAFDVTGIARAGIKDVTGSGGGTQGGSTITQQLVKNDQGWTYDHSVGRKIKEIILAVELEREYSKKDILNGYLNLAPYGNVQYGAETAARDYFGESAKDLTLPQAALLAAIPKAPNDLSPYGGNYSPDALKGRQEYILGQMAKQGMITQQQADEAKKVDVLAQIHAAPESKYDGIKAPYFVLAAKAQLERQYGEQTVNRGGWKVTTTLDLNLQNIAEQQVQKDASTIRRYGGDDAAFVAEDTQTGQVVAAVGGLDFNNPDYGKLNFVEQPISPGSSIKPYTYATLVNDTGAGAGSVLYDSQDALPNYPCTNKTVPEAKQGGNCLWDNSRTYANAITLRYALGNSLNVPAVKALLSVVPNNTNASINKVDNNIYAMQSGGSGYGYNCYAQGQDVSVANHSDSVQCGPSSGIGDGAYLHLDEHVNGIATLGRLGNFVQQSYISKIVDSNGKEVQLITQPSKQVIRPDAAYIVDDILSDPNASYFSAAAKYQHQKNGWHFAVKTGTTNDEYDSLQMSWSTKYTIGVWVGNHTRTVAMANGATEATTSPIARGFMEAAHANLPASNWKQPSTVKTAPAFIFRGHVYGSVTPSPSTDLFPSNYQPKSGSSNSTQTIDKVSGKLATSCTPADAKETVGGADSNAWSIDPFHKGGASASTISGSDDVHDCDSNSLPQISLTLPGNGSCKSTDNGGKGCAITATVTQGKNPLSSDKFPGKIGFVINGNEVSSAAVSSSPSSATFYYQPTFSGSATVNAYVLDSVLYRATDSGTLNFTQDSSGQTSGSNSSTSGTGPGSGNNGH